MHEQVRWKTLRSFTIEIFKEEMKLEHERRVEEKKN